MIEGERQASRRPYSFLDHPIQRILHGAENNLWELIWRETQTNRGQTPSWIVFKPRLTIEIASLASGATVARSLSQHTVGSFIPCMSNAEFEAAFHRSVHSRLEAPVSYPSGFNARQFAAVFWLSARAAALLDPTLCMGCFHLTERMAITLAEATLMDVLDFVCARGVQHTFRLSYAEDVAYQRLIAACAGGLDRVYGRMMACLQGLMSSNLSVASSVQAHGRRGAGVCMHPSPECEVSLFRLSEIPPVADWERQNCSAIVKRLTECGMLPLQMHYCAGVPIETSMRLFRVFKPLRWIAPPSSLGRSLAERFVYSMFAAHLEAASSVCSKTDWMLPVVLAWKRTVVDIHSYEARILFEVGGEMLSLGAAVAVARGLRETHLVSFPGYSGRLFPRIRVRRERCPLCGCMYVVIEAERDYEKYKTCPFCELKEAIRLKRRVLQGESDAPTE